MPDTLTTKTDLLDHVSAMVCMWPGVDKLRPDQLAALHVFKHEFLAAGFRLYERISPDIARPILQKFMQQLVNELENNQDA
jgi:hypothetical protein